MENKNTKTDFLIVGAGPAGLICGIRLALQGHEVTVIERLKQLSRPVCGEYLSPQGVSYLKQMGLASSLEGFSQVHGMTLYSAKGREVATQFPEGTYGVALNRKVFHDRLLQIFNESGGKILFETDIQKFEYQNSFFRAQTSEGTIEAKWIIGADGRQSKVARLLEFKTLAPSHKKVALHCFLDPKQSIGQFGQMHILPGGSYIGINPINDHEVNFSIVTDQEAIKKAGSAKELINFWIAQRPELSAQFNLMTTEEIKTTSPLTRRSVDVVKGKAVLIGDASGFIDPLTGEGITTAIKTARVLSDEILKSKTVEEAFENYARRRKVDFAEKEKLNIQFQTLIKFPLATDFVALFLNLSKRLRDTFIGVIGNVYTPTEGIKVLIQRFLTERY